MLAVTGFGDRLGKGTLKPRRGSEMVKQIGVSAPDFCGDRLECHRLRAVRQQEPARGLKRGGAALFRAQAFAAY